MSSVSRCWPHRNAHFHTQLTGGQHLHRQLLACSEACLATAFPTALPLPQLTGHCQPLCHHATTTATQETENPLLAPKSQSSSPANFSIDEEAKGIAETQTQGPKLD